MQSNIIAGNDIFNNFIEYILSPLVTALSAVSFLYFLFGVTYYLTQMNREEGRVKARAHLLWGTIGLFIIFSAGGILKLIGSYVGGVFF